MVQQHSSHRIQEDYEKVVGDNKAAFESSLTNQLSSILRTDTANIRNMRIWPGSVEVLAGLPNIL